MLSKLYAINNKEKRKKQHQTWILKNNFSLTPEDYSALLQKQDGVCYICKKPETKITKGVLCRLAVDHNHKTGRVRGLLCDKCNRGLGYFKDSPTLLRVAADYLERKDN